MAEKSSLGRLLRRLRLLDGENFRSSFELHLDNQKPLISNGLKKDDKPSYIWELKWLNIILITLFHLVAVHAIITDLFNVTPMLVIWGIFNGLLSGLGVTAGAHRLWAHRSYKAKLPFQIFLLYCFTLAGQNDVYEWVRDHRVHHKYTDTDADPHNAQRGFFFSHVGWLMVRKHPKVIEKGKTIDMSDIENDPLLAWHRRYFIPLKILITFVIPTIVPPLFWGETWSYSIRGMCFVRYMGTLNITWSVNSAAHIWGDKPYQANINPSENKLVSMISLGEGWHNYHHVFPWDYKAAEFGPSRNSITTTVIDLGARLGLVWDRKEPSQGLIESVAKNRGDGSWQGHHHSPQHWSEVNEETLEEHSSEL